MTYRVSAEYPAPFFMGRCEPPACAAPHGVMASPAREHIKAGLAEAGVNAGPDCNLNALPVF